MYLLPGKTEVMPEARDWTARISLAALARSVMLVWGSRASITLTYSGCCNKKKVQETVDF